MTCDAGRPGTGETPVSIIAMPTPLPVSVAAGLVLALMIVRTSASEVVKVLVEVPDSHRPAQPPPGAAVPEVAGATGTAEASITREAVFTRAANVAPDRRQGRTEVRIEGAPSGVLRSGGERVRRGERVRLCVIL